MLLLDNLQNNTGPFTSTKLTPPPTPLIYFEHYAMLMVHPTTGETISSYKQLMNNPVTANMWQMACGKDFRSMCHGDTKMGAKGTNAMFVMKPEEGNHMLTARLATYANIIVDYQPQKVDPYHIQITAGDYQINYPGEPQPILFTLLVDNFGMKYINKDDVNHLIKFLKQKYKLTKDLDRNLYCGIKLKWNYDYRTLDILMPGYIIKQLQKYKHAIPTKPKHCPYTPQPRQYGSNAQSHCP
jgi:hypothetical protein